MGGWFSSAPDTPRPIKISDLLQENATEVGRFREELRRLGFTVVELNDEFVGLCDKYRKTCDQWFKDNAFGEKKKFESKYKDELFEQMGRRPNEGYILTANKKEYLKFKAGTHRELFPTDEIHDQCQVLITQWRTISEACLDAILTEPCSDEKTNEQTAIVTQEELDGIKQFGKIHGSVSLIHYFKQLRGEKEEKKLTEEEELSNRTVEIPLGEHVDTGVITCILCSDIPGLDMMDRRSNKYFLCESMYEPARHMFVIAGRKLELFSSKKPITPTWHQVKIDVNTERYSLLYFWEIQKDH